MFSKLPFHGYPYLRLSSFFSSIAQQRLFLQYRNLVELISKSTLTRHQEQTYTMIWLRAVWVILVFSSVSCTKELLSNLLLALVFSLQFLSPKRTKAHNCWAKLTPDVPKRVDSILLRESSYNILWMFLWENISCCRQVSFFRHHSRLPGR